MLRPKETGLSIRWPNHPLTPNTFPYADRPLAVVRHSKLLLRNASDSSAMEAALIITEDYWQLYSACITIHCQLSRKLISFSFPQTTIAKCIRRLSNGGCPDYHEGLLAALFSLHHHPLPALPQTHFYRVPLMAR